MNLDPDRIRTVLREHAAESLDEIGDSATASALQAFVATPDRVFERAEGSAQFDPDRGLDLDTPFDLASVTKVFTATLVMQAIDAGLCTFDSPVSRWVEGWDEQGFAPVTLLHLLNHSSGLRAWEQYYLRYPIVPDTTTARITAEGIEAEIVAETRRPPGVRAEYSDLGYILLGRIVERILDGRLEDLVRDRIARPLDLDTVRYVSRRRGDAVIAEAAATELAPLRGGIVVGFVHDENCYIQGGVAGHAGLFGTARDVATFGRHLLAVDQGEPGIVTTETLKYAWSEAARGADGHHLGGWDTPSGDSSSAGRGFAPDATVGHLGFTGTSLWIERRREVVAVLLTNRVYPTRENDRIKSLRIAFHEAVLPPEA